MPESRTRKSAAEKQKLKAQRATKPKKIKAPASRRWVPPTFIAVGLLGVAWLITYYIAGTYIPVHGRARQLEHPHRHGRHGRRIRPGNSLAIAPAAATSTIVHGVLPATLKTSRKLQHPCPVPASGKMAGAAGVKFPGNLVPPLVPA